MNLMIFPYFLLALFTCTPLLISGKQSAFFTEEQEVAIGSTKLIFAIKNGASFETIKRLIDSGEDVNAIDIEFLRSYKPVLRYALDRGTDAESVSIIKALLEAGANVNHCTYNRVHDKNLYGMMPLLSYATIYSSPEIVLLFIQYGADVNQNLGQDRSEPMLSNKTALRYAEELGKKETSSLLKKAGALRIKPLK
jgi:ankyrin repeat protein